jgi:hypothetical protein
MRLNTNPKGVSGFLWEVGIMAGVAPAAYYSDGLAVHAEVQLLNPKMGFGFTFNHDYEITLQISVGTFSEIAIMGGKSFDL